MIALARRLVAAVLCRYDVHDLPNGFRRIDVDEMRPNVPTWTAGCRWCRCTFIVQAEPAFDALTAIVAANRGRSR